MSKKNKKQGSRFGLGDSILLVAAFVLMTVGTYQLMNAFAGSNKPQLDLTSGSVMIVRADKRSGGSGTVIKSSASESFILTNMHVCQVVENGGGLVITDNGDEHLVLTYTSSFLHDLCVIRVAADLGVNASIAKKAPKLYSSATIVGHPRLRPTTITKGVFSKREVIQVMMGLRKCTEKEANSRDGNGMICFFLGGFPIITTFEAQFVTANISPGSSGSPVYNSSGEIAGVVFAGSGENSPGFIVPLESVNNFLSQDFENGLNLFNAVVPNNSFELTAKDLIQGSHTSSFNENLAKLCVSENTTQYQIVNTICHDSKKDTLWRN